MTLLFDHEQNFWKRVDKQNDPSACWNWLGCVETSGYGVLKVKGKKIGAHVYAWLITNRRAVSSGHEICHTCIKNRKCCNPAHLYEGTRSQNMLDAVAAGTHYANRGNLSKQQVLEIYHRARAGERNCDLATEYGCSKNVVKHIKRGQNWAWLTGATKP